MNRLKSQIEIQSNSLSYLFPLIGIFLLFYIVQNILLDYGMLWIHPEQPLIRMPLVSNSGFNLTWENILDNFRWNEKEVRTRQLSDVVLLLNIKFRLFLWKYVTPHPSFSITWVFTLLSPLLLFAFLSHWSSNRIVAWVGTLVFVSSPATLSGLVFLHNPAKPMVIFHLLFCLWYISKKLKTNSFRTYHLYLVISSLIFFGFFIDETFFVIGLAIPLLFPSLFSFDFRGIQNVAYLFIPLFFYVAFVTLAMPRLMTFAGWTHWDFWQNAIGVGNTGISKFSFGDMVANLWVLLEDHLFLKMLGSIIGGILFVGLIAVIIVAARRISPELKQKWVRVLILLVAYCAVLTVIHTRHYPRLDNSFYYGGLFSLFWAMGIGLLASNFSNRATRWSNLMVIVSCCLIQLSNFELASEQWIKQHETPIIAQAYRIPFTGKKEPLTRSSLKRIWQNRKDDNFVKNAKSKLPIRAAGVIHEIQILNEIEKRDS